MAADYPNIATLRRLAGERWIIRQIKSGKLNSRRSGITLEEVTAKRRKKPERQHRPLPGSRQRSGLEEMTRDGGAPPLDQTAQPAPEARQKTN